jgi:hypothetical protein
VNILLSVTLISLPWLPTWNPHSFPRLSRDEWIKDRSKRDSC